MNLNFGRSGLTNAVASPFLKTNFEQLEGTIDLLKDTAELRRLGLTEEDIAGYEEFFIDSYISIAPTDGDN